MSEPSEAARREIIKGMKSPFSNGFWIALRERIASGSIPSQIRVVERTFGAGAMIRQGMWSGIASS
jgi:hypothetical protein